MRSWVATCGGVGPKKFFVKGLASDFVGEIGVCIEARERCINIGQVLFNGIEIEGALVGIHACIVGRAPL